MRRPTYKSFILVIIIVGALLYFKSLFNSFVWDDEELILNNDIVHSIANIGIIFRGSNFNTGGANSLTGVYFKPFLSLYFATIYTLFGPNQFFFHLFQMLMHIANSVFVFILLRHSLFRCFENVQKSILEATALFGSLLFLVHPLNVEATVYIAAAQDVMFFFFGMLALLSVVFRKKFKKIIKIEPLFVTYILLIATMFSKESGALFFVILPVYTFIFRKKLFLKSIALLIAAVITYCIFRFVIADVYLSLGELMPITRATFGQRLLTMPKIIFYFISNFFFPNKLAISQHWVITEATWEDFYFPLIIDVILVSGFVFLLFKIIKEKTEKKWYLFFLIWAIAGFGMHSQIYPLDMTVADRWFYFPSVGVIGMLIIIIINILKFIHIKYPQIGKKVLKFSLILSILILSLLSLRSFIRILDWNDGLTLFSHDEKINKDAFDLENNLGVELFRVGKINEAKPHFEKSTELAPHWWTNWNNLGVCLENEGDLEKAEEHYLRSIENSTYYLAYQNYARILIIQEKYEEAKEFLENEALRIFPYNENLRSMYVYINKLNEE